MRLLSILVFSLCLLLNLRISNAMEIKMNSEKSSIEKPTKVRKINKDYSLELSDGSTVLLLGIGEITNPKVFDLLNEILLNKNVICEEDALAKSNRYKYVYIWGQDTSRAKELINQRDIEFKGFLNVEDGISSPKKGISVFLNATLIKGGFAKIDLEQNFVLKEQFLKWQNQTKP